ncbi:response regulator transcription factor [Azoarcus sp. DN11]|uniref:response regulator n=1 Tax=Azoarcus sp. DN11 TaxID=356837 RepID=UPI000EB1864F|nr:response regulator transcription factor [Azoarcus sp. DN11]AYH45609.1 DNA-binding response regulator [Azoarcus sp. DN11]
MTIKVLLADDHAVVRDGLGLVLQSQTDMQVIGVAADGREALHQAVQHEPDVVVMDIAMPVLNGIEATQQIRDRCPDTEVVILSVHSSAEHVFRALRAGALGYVLKESAGAEVIDAVRAVHTGKRYLGTKISDTVIEDYIRQRHTVSPLEDLSPRERQILQLVVEGRTSAEVAEILAISPKSVDTYRSRMMQKLGIGDLPSLVKFAIQHGLTSLD